MKQYKNLIISAVVIIILVIAGLFIFKGKKVATSTDVTFTTTEQDEIENSRQLAAEYVDSLDYFGSPIKKFKITKVSEPIKLPSKYNVDGNEVYGFDMSFEVTPEDITKVGVIAGNGEVSGDSIINLFRSIRYTKTSEKDGKMVYKIVNAATEPTQVSLEPQPAQ